MASADLENGYVKIPNGLMERLAEFRLSGREHQILWVIIRKTYGWNKMMDRISLKQFSELTGIPRHKCCEILQGLVERKIVSKGVPKKGNTRYVTYGIQSNFQKWQVFPKKGTVPEKGNKVFPKKGTKCSRKRELQKTLIKDTNQKTHRFERNSIEIELSNLLFTRIRRFKPDYREPNLQSWAKHIDYMIRLDGRAPHQIRQVILWCTDDPFWQVNILSTQKLRKHFDRLEIQMMKRKNHDRNDTGVRLQYLD